MQWTASLPKEFNHTYEEYCQLPEDLRVELIEGRYWMSPSPLFRHQTVSGNLYHAIRNWLEKNPAGITVAAPMDVVFSKHNVVQPDILFISKERKNIIQEKRIQGAPDLVMEILSPWDPGRDLITKRWLYEKYGVQEYWIVNPEEKNILVFVRKGDRFEVQGTYTDKDEVKSGVLSGFSVTVSEIFEE